ncbi:uncharacterized protein LOC129807327 [Phlebotomus papatasi]|uniref:uncharacterized protein LOC129807327 n=1 Tax=Phlebotomus papatasi TaxID=29031 RepID=UPI00248415B9|nr:uncharacterized protein LOC129807327 [Phlebotomus papatasi]
MLKKTIYSVIILLGGAFLTEGFTVDESPKYSCILPVKPVEYGHFAPLVYKDNGQLASATSNAILLMNGDRVTISCDPGYFQYYPKLRSLNAKCVEGEKLELEDGKQETWSRSFACELRVVEEVIANNLPGCSVEEGNIEGMEFGYINPIRRKSLIVGEACYSTKEGRTIFVHAKSEPLRAEDERYLRSGPHPESRNKMDLFRALRQDSINSRLEKKMDKNDIPLMGSKTLLTASMLNNPQLHLMNRLTWNYAISYNHDGMHHWKDFQRGLEKITAKNHVEIWAGTSGLQSLNDISGVLFDFYLKDNKFPVPKFLWLVVKQGDKATGFLFSNKPKDLRRSIDKEWKPCSESCSNYWWFPDFNYGPGSDPDSVHCCSVENLRQIVPEVPAIPGITKMLDYGENVEKSMD